MLPTPDPLPQEMQEPSAAFVSIKKNKALRGCIGTTHPAQPSLAAEIIENAIGAASRDPRFPPITEAELPDLQVSVDVLTTPVVIQTVDELNPKKYGIIIIKAEKRGVLLPDLPEIDTVYRQIILAAQKAGIHDLQGATLYKFRVARYY